ncbi:hypothetical protein MTO96_028239 [Rhipicephalus appendiculatus]
MVAACAAAATRPRKSWSSRTFWNCCRKARQSTVLHRLVLGILPPTGVMTIGRWSEPQVSASVVQSYRAPSLARLMSMAVHDGRPVLRTKVKEPVFRTCKPS